MAALEIIRISKKYDDIRALSNVNLSVDNGEFCVLLGPSGCGKSTLLQIVAGLTPQDEGNIRIGGRSVDNLSPRKRDVAMVFQSYALYPHMTVAQNLGFGLRMHGLSKEAIRRRITETAGMLSIEELLERMPRELSGGQRQRVAMGRALVRRPKIFLLDEPLSNLDARLRINVRLELKRLHAELKSTFLYVTHDQVEAMTLGDKVVVMENGKVHQVGTPEAIYERPADTFVASFVGSPPINLFKARVIRVGDQMCLSGEGFRVGAGEVPADLEDRDIEVGIRPEDVYISKVPGEGFSATVEMISNLGGEKLVHVRLGSLYLTVRTSRQDSFRPGEIIPLIFNPSRFHLFFEGQRL